MNPAIINNLLCRFGLRFADPDTERQYKEWRIATAIPFSQIGYIGTIPSWLLFFVAVALLEPASLPRAGPAIGGWIILLVILTAMTYWQPTRRIVMPLAALANCVAGFLVAWLLYKVVGVNLLTPVRAGIMTGGVLIVMYFGFAIFRVPPWMALAGITPYVAFSTFYLYQDYSKEVLGLVEAGAFAAIQLIAYFGGLLVCIVIEAVTRHSFEKDQIIQAQQTSLQESRDAIRRYVPPSVAERIIQGQIANIDIPKRQEITVLFSDIVGFTDMTERVEPELMTRIINEYMKAMADIVDQYNGTLTEFMGDGLMVMFGAPENLPRPVQVQNAVRSAREMRKRLPGLNRRWHELGLKDGLEIRIGINCGTASVGSFGSEGRMTYTAIGLQVNIAARIQSHCEPGGILLSDAAYTLIKEQMDCELMGVVACKGVQAPIKVYSPRPS